jgi:protein-glucosylgalactosylhydroxylysine glucosidase
MPTRRTFLSSLVASAAAAHFPNLANTRLRADSIDRESLVRRHNPGNTRIDPLSPLSLGNGHFAFTADVTGLQTLRQVYEKDMPLCTMSEWGWHATPKPSSLEGATLRLTPYNTYGREVGYQTSSEGQTELFNWLRENPHRLHLGQIGFCRIGPSKSEITSSDISRIDQRLNLWDARLTSNFHLDGESCIVSSTVHPDLDLLAVSIESKLLGSGRVGVRFEFPYGSPAMQAADWHRSEKHTTKIGLRGKHWVEFHRVLDKDTYAVRVDWQGAAELTVGGPHSFILKPGPGNDRLAFTAHFSRTARVAPGPQVKDAFKASADHWREFWGSGGCIELAGSLDKRAEELERRIVLSQYLTAIQCSGRLPPQETGLTVNSWYGKFHLEMHWWHAAHFALVGSTLPTRKKFAVVSKDPARGKGTRPFARLFRCPLAQDGWARRPGQPISNRAFTNLATTAPNFLCGVVFSVTTGW